MKNLIILGSGRSGTSMAAGLFRNTGAHFGNRPLDSSVSNVKGYYEDQQINNVNNQVINRMMRGTAWDQVRERFRAPVQRDARCWWMATPAKVPDVAVPPITLERMRPNLERQPFCLKDPRFSTTLKAWMPHLPEGTRFLAVFREPGKVVDSMLRDAREKYDPPLPTRAKDAATAYLRVYTRLLDEWSDTESWMFVDFNDLINGDAIDALEAFAQTAVDRSEIDPSISRAKAVPDTSSALMRRCNALFDRLRERAERDITRWAVPSPTHRHSA